MACPCQLGSTNDYYGQLLAKVGSLDTFELLAAFHSAINNSDAVAARVYLDEIDKRGLEILPERREQAKKLIAEWFSGVNEFPWEKVLVWGIVGVMLLSALNSKREAV